MGLRQHGSLGFIIAPNRLALIRNGEGCRWGKPGERWVVIIINASFRSLAKWLFEQFVASLLYVMAAKEREIDMQLK